MRESVCGGEQWAGPVVDPDRAGKSGADGDPIDGLPELIHDRTVSRRDG
jgi:hypothetical protein